MRLIKYIILFIFTGYFLACGSEKEYLPVNSYEYAYKLLEQGCTIPQSELTKEQKQLYKDLIKVIVANLKIEDNTVIFMSKDEFVAEGYSTLIYNAFMKDINEMNNSLARDTLMRKIVLKEFPDNMAQMREQIEQW